MPPFLQRAGRRLQELLDVVSCSLALQLVLVSDAFYPGVSMCYFLW